MSELNLKINDELEEYDFEMKYSIADNIDTYIYEPTLKEATIEKITLNYTDFETIEDVKRIVTNLYYYILNNNEVIKFSEIDYNNFYLNCNNVSEYRTNDKLCQIITLPFQIKQDDHSKIHVYVQDKFFQKDGKKHQYDFEFDL